MSRKFDVPGLKALGLYPSDFGQQSSSSSFLSTNVARVDPSGNDGTGVVGDLANPFSTSQGAVDALATSGVTLPTLDIGSNTVDGFTTQLPLLIIKGDFATDGNVGGTVNGIIGSVFSGSAQTLILQNVLVTEIVFANSIGLTLNLMGARVANRVNNASNGSITINGSGLSSSSVGSVTASNSNTISLADVSVQTYVGNDDTVTKDCTVNLIRIPIFFLVTADVLTLEDSRNVFGLIHANSIIYNDQLLTNIVFPDSDPGVAGAGYWVGGVLTKSAG